MRLSELTENINTILQDNIVWDDKRFDNFYNYRTNKWEWDPYWFFVLEDWWKKITSSSNDTMTATYWFYVFRKYNEDSRYNDELAIQKDFETILDTLTTKSNIINEILNIEVEWFTFKDLNLDQWKMKLWTIFISFSYLTSFDCQI